MATQSRTEKLDLRLSLEAKQKLQAAAAVDHRSVSEFVLHSALVHAEETLAEQRSIVLNAEQWAEFQAALDAPPRDLPRMRRLLTEPSIFETSEADTE